MTMRLPNDGTSERQYLSLLEDIRDSGAGHDNRTGTDTLSVHGRTMRFDLSGGVIPLLTTKRVPWKAVFNELRWFLRGESNIRSLLEDKVTIWSEWPHAKFVKATGEQISVKEFEKRVLEDDAFARQWGDLGPVYGVQWRRWQGPDGKVYDQISQVIDQLKNNPSSRRILFHGWNVADIEEMALPPCHLLYQFYVSGNKLSLTLYQRSCDTFLGVPFNIASAAFLVHMMAQQVGMEPGELFWVGHDVHLYVNHLDAVAEQLTRTPRPFPRVEFKRVPDSLFDYSTQDVEIIGYEPDPTIRAEVAV